MAEAVSASVELHLTPGRTIRSTNASRRRDMCCATAYHSVLFNFTIVGGSDGGWCRCPEKLRNSQPWR